MLNKSVLVRDSFSNWRHETIGKHRKVQRVQIQVSTHLNLAAFLPNLQSLLGRVQCLPSVTPPPQWKVHEKYVVYQKSSINGSNLGNRKMSGRKSGGRGEEPLWHFLRFQRTRVKT